MPIIDLTAAAEGSDVAQNLQLALGFLQLTGFAVQNTTTTLVTTTGFYRVFGTGTLSMSSTDVSKVGFLLNDGAADKEVYQFTGFQQSGAAIMGQSYDFIIYLNAGESLKGQSSNNSSKLNGTVRQIADNNGSLIQPAGFTPQ